MEPGKVPMDDYIGTIISKLISDAPDEPRSAASRQTNPSLSVINHPDS